MTVYAAANGLNGYGMIIFDQKQKHITLEFHPMNEDRKPMTADVAGWPMAVKF